MAANSASAVTVGPPSGGVATLIAKANLRRSVLRIQNRGSASIFYGGSPSVTTANGFEIAPGAVESFWSDDRDFCCRNAFYAAAASNQDVRVFEGFSEVSR